MKPIHLLTECVSEPVRGIFFDIDDTFTLRGRIPAVAFQALWRAKEAGLRLVPITGRPAGWCDHIARMWPVDGVVGENGAFYFWYDGEKRKLGKRFLDPEEVRADNRRRLAGVRDDILASVPGTAVASDQLYREADLAIDYCEDVAPLPPEQVDQIGRIFERHGAFFKISSIHVNGWFGSYDKLTMTRLFARERWGLDLDRRQQRFVFCGDSPNDEPLFEYFPCSVGVRNVLHFAERMKHLPRFLTNAEGGEGFAEVVGVLLARQRG